MKCARYCVAAQAPFVVSAMVELAARSDDLGVTRRSLQIKIEMVLPWVADSLAWQLDGRLFTEGPTFFLECRRNLLYLAHFKPPFRRAMGPREKQKKPRPQLRFAAGSSKLFALARS